MAYPITKRKNCTVKEILQKFDSITKILNIYYNCVIIIDI